MSNPVFAKYWSIESGDNSYGKFGYEMSESDLSLFNELDQVNPGAGNYAEVMIERSISGDVSIEQYGHKKGNKAKVVQSDSDGSVAKIWQKGKSNTALITQTGANNRAYIAQHGKSNKAWINQDGDNNIAAILQKGRGSSLSINQTGSGNEAYVVDFGGSNYGISQNGGDYVAIIGGKGMSVNVTQN